VTEELPSDYEQSVREELLRVQERLAKLTPVGEAGSLEPKIAAFRPGAANEITIIADDRPARKVGAVRGFIGLVLAICIIGGAIAWRTPYGEEARQMIAAWAPQFAATTSSQTEVTGPSAQQQVAAADAGAPQTPSTDQAAQQPPPTAPAAQQPPQTAAAQQPPQTAAAQQPPQPAAAQQPPQSGADQLSPPTAVAAAPQDTTTAAPSPDLSSSLQAIARNIGGLQQAVEQLKTTQDQMVHENAKVVEQLRASQEQMTRLLAKASEQNPHARMAAAPKPVAAPTRRPVATLPPPQPLPPQAEQVPVQADDLPITRPPKPVP